MNLKIALRARHRLDEAELHALVDTAEAALRARGIPVPKLTGDIFEHAERLSVALPDDVSAPAPSAAATSADAASADLFAEYERVKGDPTARAEFFAKHEAQILRAIDRDRRERAVSRPNLAGAALVAEYEKVKGDPKARAEFLAKHEKELDAAFN